MRGTLMGIAMLVACTSHKPLREAYEVSGHVDVAVRGVGKVPAEIRHVPGGFTIVAPDGRTIAPQQVTRIEKTSHGRGALQGLGYGALIGGGFGALIGYAGTDEDDILFNSKGEMALIGGVVVGLAGGFIGLVSGAIMGSTVVYEDRASTTAIKVGGPRGSVAGMTLSF